MIEMMMGNDYLRQRFARPQASGLSDCSESTGLSWNLKQCEVIIELKHDAMVARPTKKPNPFANLLHGDVFRQWHRKGRGLNRGGRRQISQGAIDCVFRQLQIQFYILIHLRFYTLG